MGRGKEIGLWKGHNFSIVFYGFIMWNKTGGKRKEQVVFTQTEK